MDPIQKIDFGAVVCTVLLAFFLLQVKVNAQIKQDRIDRCEEGVSSLPSRKVCEEMILYNDI